ncbi:hypothetical protein DUI87_19147 [Hirundo rustica rustica]|uniref:Uncharacterized protein n=1 Tax=Hirundo rustica rustica TaxID=333673 RepID=A0A3M0JTR4_HIRRU|nr:hypothetical protein DUI87_19147 [Hirundo rustica rustica]
MQTLALTLQMEARELGEAKGAVCSREFSASAGNAEKSQLPCCNLGSEITRPTKSNTSNLKQDPEIQFLLRGPRTREQVKCYKDIFCLGQMKDVFKIMSIGSPKKASQELSLPCQVDPLELPVMDALVFVCTQVPVLCPVVSPLRVGADPQLARVNTDTKFPVRFGFSA